MSGWIKKNKNKLFFSIIQLLPFIILYILSNTVLKDLYLFEWMARNSYAYIWLIIIGFTFTNRMVYSVSLVISNVFGILIGQFLGDWMQNKNIQTITSDMTAEQQARLHLHHGFEIWIVAVLLFFSLSLLIHKYMKRQKC